MRNAKYCMTSKTRRYGDTDYKLFATDRLPCIVPSYGRIGGLYCYVRLRLSVCLCHVSHNACEKFSHKTEQPSVCNEET